MFTNRKDEIVDLVRKSGFISVKDLSRIFKVSEVTIRRDLRELHFEKRLKRKFGGAVSFEYLPLTNNELAQPTPVGSVYEEPLPDSVDILIDINGIISAGRVYRDEKEEPYATAVAQVNQTGKKVIISTDDYQGARDLGLWAARYAQKHFAGRAEILDLTADSATAQERSRGFLDGFRQILPGCQVAFSLRSDGSAFQLTSDALKVHHQ
ncbi:MAG: DeoR family transcriptional regulator, partial [Planctomycetes bacterium]|nr:DeoR family transcriptional regulator [Planctomycetota bacterium]